MCQINDVAAKMNVFENSRTGTEKAKCTQRDKRIFTARRRAEIVRVEYREMPC